MTIDTIAKSSETYDNNNVHAAIKPLIYSNGPLSAKDYLSLKRICKSQLNAAAFSREEYKKKSMYGLAFALFRHIATIKPDVKSCVKEVMRDFEPKILSDYFAGFLRDVYTSKNGTAEEIISKAKNSLANIGMNERNLDIVIERARIAYRPRNYVKQQIRYIID